VTVVSNTSPLTNLAAIGRFDLLRLLFGTIHIAEGLWSDLNAQGQAWPGVAEVAAADWIHRHEVQDRNLVRALRRDLDPGEADRVVLMLELKADVGIVDEKEARRWCAQFGLQVTGVVGLLLQAKQRGILDSVRPSIDRLRFEAGFYLAVPFYRQILTRADE